MIPHAVGQLSLQTTTTEACVLWSPQNTTAESVHCSERPRMMQLRPEANLKKKKKKVEWWFSRGWGEIRSYYKIETVSVLHDEKSSGGQNSYNVHLTLLNCTLKKGQDGKFSVYFATILKTATNAE